MIEEPAISRDLQVLLDLINDRESVTRGGDFLDCPIIFVKPHGTQYKKRAQGHRYIKRRLRREGFSKASLFGTPARGNCVENAH